MAAKIYDTLVVGSGFFGSVVARELKDSGENVLVLDRNSHIGGLCHTSRPDEGKIIVNSYGAHIFSTNNKGIWDYVQRFARFRDYRYIVKSKIGDEFFTYPLNLESLNRFFGTRFSQQQMKRHIEAQRVPIGRPQNFEEVCLKDFGEEIYRGFVYGYAKKQWGREPKQLPIDMINRSGLQFSNEERYYRGKYVGYPEEGYTSLFERLLDGIDVALEVDFLEDRSYWSAQAKKIVYTGPLDALFDNCYGKMSWRTIRFERQRIERSREQVAFNVHSPTLEERWSKSSEPSQLPGWSEEAPHTYVVREFYEDHQRADRFLLKPFRNSTSLKVFEKYRLLAAAEKNYYFGGRTADYRYYDMDHTVALARKLAKDLTA